MTVPSSVDLVTLVNDQDQVIGELDKYVAHRYPLQLHRAVSVWLLRRVEKPPKNSSNWAAFEVLLQQRSPQKIVGGRWWGNTICGNVRPTESYEQCAYRRLREEMGIEAAQVQPAYTFMYQAYANEEYGEREMDQVFVGWYNGPIAMNPSEVIDYKWISLDVVWGIKDAVKTRSGQKVPLLETTIKMSKEELRQAQPIATVKAGKWSLILTPWTAAMVQDGRLWRSFQTLISKS